MALADHVWPALVTMFSRGGPLIDVPPQGQPADWVAPPLRGMSEGEQTSTPDHPWCFLLNTNDDFPTQLGPDLEVSTYRIIARLLTDHTNDSANAERILMALIEQVRDAFRSHIRLTPYVPPGVNTISYARVRTGDWGYIPLNDVWYRSVDLLLEVIEKEAKTYGA